MERMRIALLAAAAVFFGEIASAHPGEQPPPPLAVADLQCINQLPLLNGAPVTLAPLGPGIRGGNQITANGSTFTGIVLQPGLYRISWSWVGAGWQVPPSGDAFVAPQLNGDPQVWQGNPIKPQIPFIEGLILVTAANSVLEIIANTGSGNLITTGSCQLIIQQLQ
jgi:hypothetical protein